MQPNPTVPQADQFRRSVDSGLFLPPEVSRIRRVWDRAKWKLLDRCTKMLADDGLRITLECTHDACVGQKLEASRLFDGSYRLRCPHMDRVMVKHF